MCQPNEAANHKNRYIQITTAIASDIIHYEYLNGYLELHLEGNYYDNDFNYSLYKYLRDKVDTSSGVYLWHMWRGMRQGRLRYEICIENELDLAEALIAMIGHLDPVIDRFLSEYDSKAATIEECEIAPMTLPPADVSLDEEDGSSRNRQDVVLMTKNLTEVLNMELRIPEYQRIYCWPQKNVELLLEDLFDEERTHKYHLGTVILQRKENGYAIIDGQQRLVTLSLVLRELGVENISLLEERFDSVEAQKYIGYNRYLIVNYLKRCCPEDSRKKKWAEKLLNYMTFDVLLLQDASLDLAYTFFSSQNSRGKALTDYELLKSHHLRYIPESKEKQQMLLAGRWDELLISSERSTGDKSVSTILGIYLYCLRKWTRNMTWYIKEQNRVKNEFEAAPVIEEIPPFGERFEFMDPIQGGTHFFAFVDNFIQQYQHFIQTDQFRILWETISCSALLKNRHEDKSEEQETTWVGRRLRTHWWYGDIVATFLFAYYLKFGNQYLSEALSCITRLVSQLRYRTSKVNKQSLMQQAGELGIILMINQATSPTFFLAEARNAIKRLPYFNREHTGIRTDFFNREMDLYRMNSPYYNIKNFTYIHNNG